MIATSNTTKFSIVTVNPSNINPFGNITNGVKYITIDILPISVKNQSIGLYKLTLIKKL